MLCFIRIEGCSSDVIVFLRFCKILYGVDSLASWLGRVFMEKAFISVRKLHSQINVSTLEIGGAPVTRRGAGK